MEESEYLKIKEDYEKCIKDMNTDLKKNIDMLGNRDYYKKIFQYTMSFNNIDDFDINEVPDVVPVLMYPGVAIVAVDVPDIVNAPDE